MIFYFTIKNSERQFYAYPSSVQFSLQSIFGSVSTIPFPEILSDTILFDRTVLRGCFCPPVRIYSVEIITFLIVGMGFCKNDNSIFNINNLH